MNFSIHIYHLFNKSQPPSLRKTCLYSSTKCWWLWSGLNQILHNKTTTTTEQNEQIELEKLIAATTSATTTTTTEEKIDVNNLIKTLLSSPDFELIIAKHLNTKTEHFNKIVSLLQNQLRLMAQKNDQFHLEMNRCCRRQFLQIDGYVKQLVADILKTFASKRDLETRLNDVANTLNRDFDVLRANMKSRDATGTNFHNTLNQNEIRGIVAEALAVYDADKTGLVDYALESSGGQIVSTRCTENYHSRTAVVSVLGIPLWYPSNTPRVVITSGVTPGECWAFQNFPGFLVIELSNFVRVSAFSLEHIPKSLVPNGHRDSAPKTFTVWGLRGENDHDPWDFGTFEYNLEGPALQYFAVKRDDGPRFNMIELRVESNHGNLNYTCLYRFRVHGSVAAT